MSQVITFTSYRPTPRYDGRPWTEAHVEEAPTALGPWTEIDAIELDPVDADPTAPATRNFTTEAASDTAGLWYRVIFYDALGDSSQPTDPVQNGNPTSSYVTVDEVKASLDVGASSALDSEIERWSRAASRAIDGICGRRFWADTELNERRYTARTRSLIQINDVYDFETLTVDGIEWSEGSFLLLPLNAELDGEPYTSIEAVTGRFSKATGAVVVAGKFGWSAVPAQVNAAATILTVRMLTRAKRAPFGIVTAGQDVAAVMRLAKTDPDVSALLDSVTRTRPL